MAPGLRQAFQKAVFAKGPPFHIYPGAVIPVTDQESLDLLEYMKSFGEPRVLPPGVPLDEDIVAAILQHWHWLESFKQQVLDETAEYTVVEQVSTHFGKQLEILYMEALWRQIKRKKEQACSAI